MCDTDKLPAKTRIRKYLLRAQEFKCFFCEEYIEFEEGTTDHLFPKSLGYTVLSNTVVSCKRCNGAKGDVQPGYDAIRRAVTLYKSLGLTFNPSKHGSLKQQRSSFQWIKFGGSISNDGLIGQIAA